MKPRNMSGEFWAYFAPNNYIQVRSIAKTKKLAREEISRNQLIMTWEDYEKAGFRLAKIKVLVEVKP